MKEVKWSAVARSLSQMLEQTPAQFQAAVDAQTVDTNVPTRRELLGMIGSDGISALMGQGLPPGLFAYLALLDAETDRLAEEVQFCRNRLAALPV